MALISDITAMTGIISEGALRLSRPYTAGNRDLRLPADDGTIGHLFMTSFRQWRTQEFFSGVQQIQLKTEGRENGDLRAVAR
jgi:hypothetical protein